MIATASNNKGQSATDIYRRSINESASSQVMAGKTRKLAERFHTVLHSPSSRKAIEFSIMERAMEDGWKQGRFSVLENLDFEQLFNDCYGHRWNGMAAAIRADSSDLRSQSVQESLLQTMTSDQFANMLTTVIRWGAIERAELAPMSLANLVNRNIRLAPGTTKIPKFRTPADITDDCVAELEPTSFYSIPEPNMITLPEACKKKFAIGMTREMLGIDPNGAIRDEIDRQGQALDLHMEKLLVDVMFGLYDTGTVGANPFPYVEDGIMWHTFQAVGAGGPWENDITTNPLTGMYVAFETVERVIEMTRDPYTGEPVQPQGDPKLVVTNSAQRQLALDALGLSVLTKDFTAFGANGRIEITRPAGRFDISASDIVTSPYIFDRLVAWFQTTAGGGLNAANAATAARGTWLYGDLQRAFGIGTEWDRERLVQSGTGTWQYFNQEVVFAVKWLEKTTPVVLDPVVIFRNRP